MRKVVYLGAVPSSPDGGGWGRQGRSSLAPQLVDIAEFDGYIIRLTTTKTPAISTIIKDQTIPYPHSDPHHAPDTPPSEAGFLVSELLAKPKDWFKGSRGVPGVITDRMRPKATSALGLPSVWTKLYGNVATIARLLGIHRTYVNQLIYGDYVWSANLAEKMVAETELRIAELTELLPVWKQLAAEAGERKRKRRAASRERFKERWGFWPETKADKEQRWAKMRGAPGAKPEPKK